ncbi:tryptophan--tRNA ligase [Catenulispora pinistramenti]|uniref:tryptophan--tRNA ligase n=1 Tax=Catenulispora pinistramenti TaxID=2705254 RepID=UPI003F68605E
MADGAHPAPGGESAAHLTEAELAGQLIGDARQIRVLTGDRPTGALHLGHYLGSLRNRVRLADAGAELFVLVADYQVITDRDASASIADHAGGLVADYLAIGLDPARSTIFAHSAVPALNQLLLPLMSLISVPELERNPTTKAEAAASGRPALSALMLTYPVHQAADILFCRADLVPVGKDQLPHLEVTRTVARRFNTRYTPVFTEPKALISDAPSVLGSDGHKMSKSHGNTIALQAGADETAAIIKGFKTDTDRHITYDPEHRPEVSNLVLITALCRGEDPRAVAERIGSGGAAALKQAATEAVNEHLRPIRARRAELAGDRGYLSAILRRGAERATGEAEATLARVREAMGMAY